jgi:hypothetical protein
MNQDAMQITGVSGHLPLLIYPEQATYPASPCTTSLPRPAVPSDTGIHDGRLPSEDGVLSRGEGGILRLACVCTEHGTILIANEASREAQEKCSDNNQRMQVRQ